MNARTVLMKRKPWMPSPYDWLRWPRHSFRLWRRLRRLPEPTLNTRIWTSVDVFPTPAAGLDFSDDTVKVALFTSDPLPHLRDTHEEP